MNQNQPIAHVEIPRLVGVLQHWQVLLAPDGDAATITSITLADVLCVIIAMQQQFGASTSLETIIQTLVAAHLREQVEQRHARRQAHTFVA